MEKTRPLRSNHTQLLISSQKAHRPVLSETIARWRRIVLNNSGIDTSVLSAHSTRSAVTSAAKHAKLFVNRIMNAASWKNALTFSKFYDKPIITDIDEKSGHTSLKYIDKE